MIVAEQGDIQAGDYQILCPDILMNTSTHKLYKSTPFKPWTIFPSKDQLLSAKVSTLTEYDPIFFVLKEAQQILSLGNTKMRELDELFSPLIITHFKEKAISICESVKAGGDDYYKVSETMILNLLEKRFEEFVEKLSKSGIKLKTSKLEKEGDLTPVKTFALEIMKRDVPLDFMNHLVKERLKITVPVLTPTFIDTYPDRENETTKYEDNFQKTKKVSDTPKVSAKEEKLRKSAGGTASIMSFFKKPVVVPMEVEKEKTEAAQ